MSWHLEPSPEIEAWLKSMPAAPRAAHLLGLRYCAAQFEAFCTGCEWLRPLTEPTEPLELTIFHHWMHQLEVIRHADDLAATR